MGEQRVSLPEGQGVAGRRRRLNFSFTNTNHDSKGHILYPNIYGRVKHGL